MTIEARISPESHRLTQVGIPTAPVIAVAKMDVMGPKTSRYEGRVGVNQNGINVVSQLLPVERAVYGALRPDETFVEVGKYGNGDYNIANKIINSEPVVYVNGIPQTVGSRGAVELLRRLARQKGVTRMVTHEVSEALPALANEIGVDLLEKPDVYKTLSSKTGLNEAITEYTHKHPNSMLKPFGKNCTDLETVVAEVERLKMMGVGAYLKLDNVRGIVAAGGLGHLSMPIDMDAREIREKILELTQGETQFDGVTQMLLRGYRVVSLSSGQSTDGTYQVYEAHEQTVDGSSADGAKPIDAGSDLERMLGALWEETRELYKYHGLTGDQNLNAMVLSQDDYMKACEVYGPENCAQMFLTDLNYRAITGTRNAMTRYQSDTGRLIDTNNDYRYRGIKVAPAYAANPHIMIAAGKVCGLNMGRNGNSTVVNMGTFTPDLVAQHHRNHKPLKTHVIAQMPEAEKAIDQYELLLADEGLARDLAEYIQLPYVDPHDARRLSSTEYQEEMRRNVQVVLEQKTRDRQSDVTNAIRGSIWAWQ